MLAELLPKVNHEPRLPNFIIGSTKMLSTYLAQSFEIVSRDSPVSRIEIERQTRGRQTYLILVICILCIGFFLLGGRPDWTNNDNVGLATSVVFIGSLLWQHYSRSLFLIIKLTTVTYTAAAVLFTHAIWSPELWAGEAGSFLFPSTLFSYSILLLLTLSVFISSDSTMLKTLACAAVWFFSMVAAVFYVVATGQPQAKTFLVTSFVLLSLGLPLVAIDSALWLRFLNSRTRDRSSLERALAARLLGPLLVSGLLPFTIILVLS
ncbi:MAG: hypothetical protein RIC29_11745 [Rhodospirillaceae bacterium]